MKNICVFASSSDRLDAAYYELAGELGRRVAQAGCGIVYGAGDDGLMGALARGAASLGGRIVGVIPDMMNVPGVVYKACSELVVTKTMHERKAEMEKRCDAYVALPGGFGTLEELLEAIAYRQLGLHRKPIAILNIGGFYDPLIAQFDKLEKERFSTEKSRSAFCVCGDIDDVMDCVLNQRPAQSYKKNALFKEEA